MSALPRIDAGVLALVALPWLLLAVDPAWVYASLARDPWAYFGFFQDLPGHLRAHSDHYSAGRLSVLVPGWLAYCIFPPVAANLLLHVGVYTTAVLSGYVALGRTVGRRAAFLAMTAMGGHFFFVKAVGWDYVDGYVIAYFLLAAALVTQAARPGWWWRAWATAAGAAGAGMAVAYLAAAPFLAPLAVLFVVLNRTGGRHPLDAAGFWLGAGFAGAMAGMGAVSWWLGGPLLFLLPSLTFASKTFGPQLAAQYVLPPSAWIGNAGWLVFPAAVACGAVVTLLRVAARWRAGEATRSDAAAAFLQLQFLADAAGAAFKQLRGEGAFLQAMLAASWAVMAPAFLALGGQLRRWADGFTPAGFRAAAATWFAVVVAGYAVGERLPESGAGTSLVAALGAAVVAVLIVQSCPPRVLAAVTVALLLAVAGVSGRAHYRVSVSMAKQEARSRADGCQVFDPHRAECFDTISAFSRWARMLAPPGRVWYWYDLADPLGLVYDTAAHTDCHYLQVVGVRFPDLSSGKLYRGEPVQVIGDRGGAVVVMSDDPAAGERAAYWLRGCGMTVAVGEVVTLGRAPVAVRATVVWVAAR